MGPSSGYQSRSARAGQYRNYTVCANLAFKDELTLHKRPENLTTSLQKRMTNDDLEKPLQTFPSVFDHIVRKPIREDFSW